MISIDSPRLIMVPGLGCDGRLFDPLRQLGLRIETPAWIAPRPDETLPHYAQRLAQTIDTTTPYCLGGASFGGFIAMEMARRLHPRALLLLATGYSAAVVRDWVRNLDAWLGWLPAPLFKPMAGLAIGINLRHERLTPELRRLMIAMARQTPARFSKWAVKAVLPWQFEGRAQLSCPVHHLHGRLDRLMPVERSGATEVLDTAGHLINLTHVHDVARFLTTRSGITASPSDGSRLTVTGSA